MNRPKPLVLSEGPKDAPICLIGEAPGSTESALGKPFQGQAGKLLNQCLSQAGIPRTSCYITNVVKEQPEGNDITHFIKFGTKYPKRTERYDMYEEMLYKELSEVSSNVYVPLGETALYAITRLRGVTKRRGSILSAELSGRQVKIIPCIHPAAALREFLLRYLITSDLTRVRKECEFPELRPTERKLLVEPTFFECMEYLSSIQPNSSVAFDIEVSMSTNEMSCFSFARTSTDAISIPLSSRTGDYFTMDKEIEILKEMRRILEDPSIRIVGQNLEGFDMPYIFNKYGFKMTSIEDTMVAQALAMPDFKKGLDFICSIHTTEPYYKDEGKKYIKNPYGSDDRRFWLYNAKDSAVCLEALPNIIKDLAKLGNLDTYDRVKRLAEPLCFMQNFGIKVDTAGLAKAATDAKEKVKELENDLNTLAGFCINHRSPKQLLDFFYIQRGLRPYVNRKTRRPTTDDDALKRLSRKGIREAQIIREIRRLEKLTGTYYEMGIDSDGRVRCAFNPVGTESGRLSSSKNIMGTGGNMQNLPPEMKRFLIADENCLIYDIDLAKAENVCVAYISPEPYMIEAFEKNIDLHSLTASLIFSKPIEEISDEPGSCNIGGGQFSERFWGKKANHGLNYGLGYKNFAAIYEIPENEARFIVDKYHQAYPGVRNYHQWVAEELNKSRTLINCYGRRRLFLDRWGEDLLKQGYSFIPQSTVGEKMNFDGLVYIYENQQTFSPIALLNIVHDSIVIQISLDYPLSKHAECLLAIKENLEKPLKWHSREFSIRAECKVGKSLKTKDQIGWSSNSTQIVAQNISSVLKKWEATHESRAS